MNSVMIDEYYGSLYIEVYDIFNENNIHFIWLLIQKDLKDVTCKWHLIFFLRKQRFLLDISLL